MVFFVTKVPLKCYGKLWQALSKLGTVKLSRHEVQMALNNIAVEVLAKILSALGNKIYSIMTILLGGEGECALDLFLPQLLS